MTTKAKVATTSNVAKKSVKNSAKATVNNNAKKTAPKAKAEKVVTMCQSLSGETYELLGESAKVAKKLLGVTTCFVYRDGKDYERAVIDSKDLSQAMWEFINAGYRPAITYEKSEKKTVKKTEAKPKAEKKVTIKTKTKVTEETKDKVKTFQGVEQYMSLNASLIKKLGLKLERYIKKDGEASSLYVLTAKDKGTKHLHDLLTKGRMAEICHYWGFINGYKVSEKNVDEFASALGLKAVG